MRDEQDGVLGLVLGVALGAGVAILSGATRQRRRPPAKLKPVDPFKEPHRRHLVVFQIGSDWHVVPHLLDVIDLGPNLTLTWEIVGSPDWTFPLNAVVFHDKTNGQFSSGAPSHDRRKYAFRNNNSDDNVTDYSYTLKVQPPGGGAPVEVDPTIRNGPGLV